MKRYTDAEIDIMHCAAIDYANEHTTSGAEASNCFSNIIIIELLMKLLEK
jgi:hypothetical protein